MSTVPVLGSASTASHDALERRAAAQALLASPVLTVHRHPADLALVRRHSASLRSVFSKMLGYPLIVESSFARLVKTPLDSQAPVRTVRLGDGPVFGPQTYALFCLASAALLSPGTGEQILISAFIEQIRSDASAAGVPFEDSWPERRRLVAAIGLLIDWGVLTETDGTVSGWTERREEALLSIHRPLLPHLLARPLNGVVSLSALWGESAEEPRRSLRRKLVENPLVSRDGLSEAERDVLSRERTDLARLLDEHFGLTLEVRAEGALAYDTEGTLSDIAFPGPGTVRQAALLLIDVLIENGGSEAEGSQAPSESGLLCEWQLVEECLVGLSARYASSWSAAYTRDPDRLRGEVVALLESLSLATSGNSGLRLHPASARYRPAVQEMSGTRAAHRLAQPSVPAPAAGVLFGDGYPTATKTGKAS
ncbi:TIGR02678 family protein [Streptomyces sp. NPDC087420]|uniref:TIGR02678 family protein n=1 Tax=Streptomyces sp. NPDC087420 TaxID=3365785 RepID=UPI003833867A